MIERARLRLAPERNPHLGGVSLAARVVLIAVALCRPALGDGDPTRDEALTALRKAVGFFRHEVAVEGGYVWRYSADLAKREGEGKVGPTTAWVQPPGTPVVGEALLRAYELTGETGFLDAARETATALVRGQLHSGGWGQEVEFDPEKRRRFAYRVDGKPQRKARDVSILDDDRTQASLRFLTRFDRATHLKEPAIHETALRGLESLVAAQFSNGAWAQVYRRATDDAPRPPRKASYDPDDEYPRVKEYWDFYTLNDNVMADVIETLLLAADVYEDERFRESALRGGEFLVLAQMPEPQPGWAQQYDTDMHPAWARKFEPPAISGSESQSVMSTLLDLYQESGERKFLEPVPRALEYFRRSLLPDGRLARFYELRTNRPLYFTRRYELTYDDGDLPTHYSFKVPSNLDRIAERYERLAEANETPKRRQRNATSRRPSPATVRGVIEALDERGAWVEEGRLRFWGDSDPTRRVIDPRTFTRNTEILARYAGRAEE